MATVNQEMPTDAPFATWLRAAFAEVVWLTVVTRVHNQIDKI